MVTLEKNGRVFTYSERDGWAGESPELVKILQEIEAFGRESALVFNLGPHNPASERTVAEFVADVIKATVVSWEPPPNNDPPGLMY